MRPTIRLVPDFILPGLDKSTYGEHLLWEDKKNGSFKISRIHQSSDMWNEQCIEVYKAWSLKKKHWNASDPKRITKAKHRLITALRRNPEIEMLEKESTFYRFRIIHPDTSDDELYPENTANSQCTIPRNNKDEIKKRIETIEETENCDMKNILEDNKEQRDYYSFSSYETNTSFTYWPPSQPDNYDVQKVLSMPDDIFGDELYSGEIKSAVFSDRCCCEKLLDTYLCNQKCIWHGMPP